MADIQLLGTVYVRGMATIPGKSLSRYRNPERTPITILNTENGNGIRWIEVNGLLVAQQELLTHISWEMLEANGLVSGKHMIIDGWPYKCRLLQTESKNGQPSEWDILRKSFPDCWKFDTRSFWGCDKLWTIDASIAGYSPILPHCVGWRPVLEADFQLSENLVGNHITVRVGHGILQGTLIELTEYDLVFQDVIAAHMANENFRLLSGNKMIVSREAISNIQTK